MKITSFGEKTKEKTIMCLGAFDSIHKGHKKIIQTGKELGALKGANTCVLTYYNDLSSLTNKSKGLVFTFDERVRRLENLGVNEVCACNFTKEFADQSPERFLCELCDNRPIDAFICGNDFKFGKKAQGDVSFLKDFCKKRNIEVCVCDFALTEQGEKISTSMVKDFLSQGKIKEANNLLGDKYFISGVVEKGRQMGRTIGFPTANIQLSNDKFVIKHGVYSSTIFYNGKEYRGITNVGNAPTFNFEKVLVETFIDGFNGDLYGKNLTIYFDDFIREIKSFSSVNQLIDQLNNDLKVIR